MMRRHEYTRSKTEQMYTAHVVASRDTDSIHANIGLGDVVAVSRCNIATVVEEFTRIEQIVGVPSVV